MEQYIQDWLKEHPEARVYVESAWRLGYIAAAQYGLDVRQDINTPRPKNPYLPREEVKAA